MKINNVNLRSFIFAKTNNIEYVKESSNLEFVGVDGKRYILLDCNMTLPEGDLIFKSKCGTELVILDSENRDAGSNLFGVGRFLMIGVEIIK